MREIKFRAWQDDKSYNRMVHFYLSDVPKDFDIIFYPIMQYTGLKDKNDVEIYEGDIVCFEGLNDSSGFAENYRDYIAPVEWKYSGWYLGYGNFKNACVGRLDEGAAKHLEIIGTVNENPELLK